MSEAPSTVSLSESLEAAYEANIAEPVVEKTEAIQEVSKEASPEAPAEDVSEDVSVEAEPTEKVIPPEHWSDDDQKTFLSLDEQGRDFALSRDKNFEKGLTKKSAELKILRDAFQPYKHLFPAGSEVQALQQLFNAQVSLQNNPVEGIKWLMRSYGVDEKQFAPSTETVDEFADPEVTKLRAELKELQNTSERNALTAQSTQQNAMIAEINQFRDAETDGERSHPYFNEVSSVMSGLMQSGRADSLEKAYEQAVWSLPEYRDSEVEKIAAKKADETLKERTRKVEKAEKAATSVKGTNGATLEKKPETIAESLHAAYEKSVRGEL